MKKNQYWDLIIKQSNSLFDINFKDLWQYRDLLLMFVESVEVCFVEVFVWSGDVEGARQIADAPKVVLLKFSEHALMRAGNAKPAASRTITRSQGAGSGDVQACWISFSSS